LLRFYRQYAVRSTIHAKMELGALVYGNSDGPTKAAFRYSLSVLEIYSARHVYYRFSVLAVNIETQPKKAGMAALRFLSDRTNFLFFDSMSQR